VYLSTPITTFVAWQCQVDRDFIQGYSAGATCCHATLHSKILCSTIDSCLRRNGLAAQTAEDCIADGDAVLKFFGTVPSVGICAAALLIYLAVLHIATYLALWGATRKATSAKAGSMTAG
jgi:hypothetical protein